MGYEETPRKQYKQTKADTPQKEKKMKTKSTQPKETKAPKTIKLKTLVIAVLILLSHVGAFVGGVVANNSYSNMIEAHAEARAQALLKSDGKQ